jgi:hypothetical protein
LFPGAPLGEQEIKITVALSQRNLEQLESEFWTVSDPKNFNYGTSDFLKSSIPMRVEIKRCEINETRMS